jgi:hypothetical protein
MRVINHTAYDTAVLRRAALATWRYLYDQPMQRRLVADDPRVQVQPLRRTIPDRIFVLYKGDRAPTRARGDDVILRLPKLNGGEWHHLKRQEHGIETEPTETDGPPLVRNVVQAFCHHFGSQSLPFSTWRAHWSSIMQDKHNRLPRLLPLKKVRPAPPKADPNVLKLRRLVERERRLTRKLKLMQTYLKKVQRERKRLLRRMEVP